MDPQGQPVRQRLAFSSVPATLNRPQAASSASMASLNSLLNPETTDESNARLQRARSPRTSPSPPENPSEDAIPDQAYYGHAEARPHLPHPDCPNTFACLPDSEGRPQHTLPVILRCAILGSPKKRLTIREIYAAMERKYPYYRSAGPAWKQSVRHHLSLNRLFERQPRPATDPGFGSYWTVNLDAPPGTKRPRKRGRAKQPEVHEEPAAAAASTSTALASSAPPPVPPEPIRPISTVAAAAPPTASPTTPLASTARPVVSPVRMVAPSAHPVVSPARPVVSPNRPVAPPARAVAPPARTVAPPARAVAPPSPTVVRSPPPARMSSPPTPSPPPPPPPYPVSSMSSQKQPAPRTELPPIATLRPVDSRSFSQTSAVRTGDYEDDEDDDDEMEWEPSGDETRMTDDDYESEEELIYQYDPRRSNTTSTYTLPSYHPPPQPTRSVLHGVFSGYTSVEHPEAAIDRLKMEMAGLRRQSSDAVASAVRLSGQLAAAQEEAARARAALKIAESMLEDETRRRLHAEKTVEEEARRRHAAEDALRTYQSHRRPPAYSSSRS